MEKTLKLTSISDPQIEIREEIIPEKIEELADSIREVGLIHRIIVRPIKGGYELVAGRHRFLAHRAMGKKTINVVVQGYDDDKTLMVRVHENLFRADITTVDEANLVGALHYEMKWELNEIEKRLRKGKQWVQDRIDVFHMPPVLKHALSKRAIGVGIALELFVITDEEKRNFFLKTAIDHGATRRQVINWRQEYQNIDFKGGAPATPIDLTDGQPELPHLGIECGVCTRQIKVNESHMIGACGNCFSEILLAKKRLGEDPLKAQ